MSRRKREYAYHVKLKLIFENPSLMPFPFEGIVVTDKESVAREFTEHSIKEWLKNDPEKSEHPIKEVRITSAKRLIKDFIIQPKDASDS